MGGAPPLDPEKMKAISHSLLPKPNFEVDDPPSEPGDNEAPEETPMMGGVGSAYHVNQEMARGNVDEPVSLRGARQMVEDAKKKAEQQAPARKPMSPESIRALEAAKEATEKEAEATEPVNSEHPLKEDATAAELEKATEKMVNPRPDLFDFESIAAAQKMLVQPSRRKKIEEKLEDLDIADMIVKREIQQTVTVVPGKLIYQFRTFNQHENLFCLRYVYDMSGSVAYIEELLNTCKLVCSLVAVNGALLPDHRKGVGSDKEEVDKDLFQKKMFHVANLPVQLIADISVNAIWFNERVTRLFSVENLKNG